jgi:subtilisin family serine protease
MTLESSSLINIDDFRTAFPGVDGSGYSVVILDTGADMDHTFFGADLDDNGIADRIVYQYDFADGDASAEAVESHGCNVAGIVGSSDSTYTGMAPGCNLIILKVFTDAGDGDFGYVESALQWIDTNVSTYNIVSVNMSLGDSENHTSPINLYGIDDELVALAAQDVIVASSSGNDFHTFGSAQGIGYPAADPYSLSVGAVYDADIGGVSYSSGAQAYTTGADRVCPFSQRHSDLAMSSIFAPGAEITNAGLNNGTVTMHGTSQSSPHIAGIAALAQDLAGSRLGRRLTPAEFTGIIQSSAVDIIDGDDEDDNVTNTGLTFPRVDVMAMAQAITAMAVSGIHIVELSSGVDAENINFGNQPSCGAWGYYPADIDSDCYVNISDLQILGDNWIDGPIGDIDENAVVDMNDFVQLSTQWLLCTDPADPNCSVPLH